MLVVKGDHGFSHGMDRVPQPLLPGILGMKLPSFPTRRARFFFLWRPEKKQNKIPATFFVVFFAVKTSFGNEG